MLPSNILNNNSETYKIASLSQFDNLEKIKECVKLEISLL